MAKKVVIEYSLVEESSSKPNQEIADEIYNELSKGIIHIPWCCEVKKVAVTENSFYPSMV